MDIKRFITKYLLIAIGLAILRVLMSELVPDLFTNTIVGDGFTHTKTTFFSIYQTNIFNIIFGIIMSIDLYRIGQNWIIIPILTVISATAGLFFFSILILYNLINKYEQI
jgi:hypothetical protein